MIRLLGLVLMFALASAICLAPLHLSAEEGPAEKKEHKTDWLYKAKWGIMFHYTPGIMQYTEPKVKSFDAEQWDKTIAEFDVDGLAQQLKEIGAGYLLITSRHAHPAAIAPNSVIEKASPGICPKRDLIADLIVALDKQDIPLMLYYPTGMGVDKPKGAQHSAAVIEEFSRRYGKKVRGWWLDNNSGDAQLQKLIADACRAGNPGSLVAFSPPHNPKPNSKYEDYTAGNCHGPAEITCQGRFLAGEQWHMLSYLGYTWSGYSQKGPGPRFPPAKAVSLTMRFLPKGGVMTWDVKPSRKGLIADEFLPALRQIGKAAANVNR